MSSCLPLAAGPGSYHGRLTVNGQTLHGSLLVREDPEAGKVQ